MARSRSRYRTARPGNGPLDAIPKAALRNSQQAHLNPITGVQSQAQGSDSSSPSILRTPGNEIVRFDQQADQSGLESMCPSTSTPPLQVFSSTPLDYAPLVAQDAHTRRQLGDPTRRMKHSSTQESRDERAKREAYATLTGEAEPQLRLRQEPRDKEGSGQNRKRGIGKEEGQRQMQNEPREMNSFEKKRSEGSRRAEVPLDALEPPLSVKRNLAKETLGPALKHSQEVIAGTGSKATANHASKEKTSISHPSTKPPGSGAVVVGYDAPISAVNAGVRKVMVNCKQSSTFLNITPATTPVDIIRSAADAMSEEINATAMVLIESFKQVGLERPLRSYEHIRDVLNSWDQDDQNFLIIVPSPTGGNDEALDAKKVPVLQPDETSVHMYYSQRPGQWDKRWITLRSDGQVTVAKQKHGEAKNACHMSDFDIYVPTARQLAKKIRPPKKLCFAVKSQQKSSMFLSTINFVHFFATSDESLAASWYKAVQEWRSWYLIHVMGEGQNRPTTVEKSTGELAHKNQTDMISQKPRHQRHSSTALAAEEIGPFKDLQEAKSMEHADAAWPEGRARFLADDISGAKVLHTRTRSTRAIGGPPVSFPTKLVNAANDGATPKNSPAPRHRQNKPLREQSKEPFAATGVLGRTYSQRPKTRPNHEAGSAAHPRPPLEQNSQRTQECTLPIRPANNEPQALTRASSQLRKHKPLVDLTPQYHDLPQHVKKGRGIMPDQIPAGGLVDIATSPEVAIPIPSASTWRRPGTSNGVGTDTQRTATIRATDRPLLGSTEAMRKDDEEAFITGGLVAKVGLSQGDRGQGKGCMTGHREMKCPMLDISEPSTYMPGSLLASVEKHMVNRERRREVVMPFGERI
ncbi:hypothetical protein MMC24_005855 [Lignoscripta atroalba]|nr:hypothetical protein [Lignoscripta atroalba]